MAGSLDLQNTIMPRANALGIQSIEILAAYCRISPTTLRRALDGLGNTELLKKVRSRLIELETLQGFMRPIPLDFRQRAAIVSLEHSLRNRYAFVKIFNATDDPNSDVKDSEEVFGDAA
jgi:hypothetical protein